MALGGTVRGKKTTLRTAVPTDLETYNSWMADLRVRRAHSPWHEPAMPATWRERFKEVAQDKQQILWSIEADDALVGLVSASVWPMGSGFDIHHLVIDPDRWRKGYGFDAALALHRYVFDYLDLRRVMVDVRADNAAALRIADQLGYAEYARGHDVHYRDGAYVDEVKLLMEKETWARKWSGEREYAPLAADATR